MKPTLLRKLGTRDAALIVMGGIIGSGIFRTPSLVAQRLHTAPLIMGAWIAGGAFAMLGGPCSSPSWPRAGRATAASMPM
jgi:APA family basic amino acid/polyamine antiporter